MNIATAGGLLGAANPMISGWVRDSVQWTLCHNCHVLTTIALAATLLDHNPDVALAPYSSKEEREVFLAPARKVLADLPGVCDSALRVEYQMSSACLSASDLVLSAELLEAWKHHCDLYPHAELLDWPIEAFNFYRRLIDDPASDFCRMLVSAKPSFERLLQDFRGMGYLKGIRTIYGHMPRKAGRLTPWWRAWPERLSDRLGGK